MVGLGRGHRGNGEVSPFMFRVFFKVLLSYFVVEVGTAGLSQEEVAQAKPLHPVTGWRRRVQKLLIVLGRFGLFAAGFRIKVRGKRVRGRGGSRDPSARIDYLSC